MLPWEKKGTAAKIVGRLKPDGTMAYGGEVKNEESFGEDKDLHSLCQELLAAFKSDSVSGVASCLRMIIQEVQDADRKEDIEVLPAGE